MSSAISDHSFAKDIQAARSGDLQSQGRVLESCREYLLAIAGRGIGVDLAAKTGASDLVQETLLGAHVNFSKFRGGSRDELLAWLRAILQNRLAYAVRHYRDTEKRRVGREVAGVELTEGGARDANFTNVTTPGTCAARRETHEALQAALDRLPEDYRKAVLWRWKEQPDPPSPLGHKKEAWALAYSPDGQTLASSSDDGTVKLWDAATGDLRRTLTGYPSLVASVAYSPDGKLIASAGFDKNVGLWDAATGKRLGLLKGHTGFLRSVRFSHDGKLLASTGNDMTVRLWDVATRAAKGEPLKGHTGILYAVAFSPDGRFVCSAGDDRKAFFWDVVTGRKVSEFAVESNIQAIAFSPDGKTLATTAVDGGITLWDTASGTSRPPLRGHSLAILGVTFSPDGRTLATAGRDKTVRLWDPATGQELLSLKGHKDRVHAVAFSPDGSTLASASFDGAIKIWRTGTRAE